MQRCSCSKGVHLKCSFLFFSRFRTFGSSYSWSSPPAASLILLEIPHLPTLCLPLRSPPACIPPFFNLAAPLPMQHSRHTLTSKSLIPFRPLRILSSCTLTTVSCFWLFFYSSCFLFLPECFKVLQWSVGGLRVRSTERLHFILSHSIYLIGIQESNLNSSSFFRVSEFSVPRSDRTRSRSGILSPEATHASGDVIFAKQSLSFSKLSTTSLCLLDSYFDYVGVNISLNNSSSLSFLNFYIPPVFSSLAYIRTDSFSPSILSSSKNMFILETSIAITRSGTQKVLQFSVGMKYSIGSSPLNPSPSMTLIYLLFPFALLAVAPPLTFSLLPPLSSYLAPGR